MANATIDNWETLLSSPAQVEAPVPEPDQEGPRKCQTEVLSLPLPLAKGRAVVAYSNETANRTGDDEIVDMESWTGLHVEVLVSGTSPSVVITALGSASAGNFLTLPDPNAVKTVTASVSYDIHCGARKARFDLSSISGTFGSQQGFTVTVTPFLARPELPGSYTTATHTTLGVTTASQAALAANNSALYRIFINDSDTVIYLRKGATAVANEGIRLNASGGSYEMTLQLGNLFRGAVNAIHGGTGSKVLLIEEGT